MKKNSAQSSKIVYIHTFGCKVNQYESQVIAENFTKQGFNLTDNPDKADVLVVNSCTVTGEADRQCRQLIRRAIRKNPNIETIVTGCYAVNSPEEILKDIPSVKIINKETLLKNSSYITRFEGHSRAFVKIQDGCDAFCSYCIVPYVRSEMISRPEHEVIEEVKILVSNGYPEIVLTGVRLGRFSGGLANILSKILALDGDFRIRLSSLEFREVTDGLLYLMKSNPKRLCRHLHIPLQSGSNNVLKAMKRPYTAPEFLEKIERIKKLMPDMGITTDVITGFPGETDRDFEQTREFISKAEFSRLHVFRYSKRAGTLAAGFKGIVPQEKAKERSVVLRELDLKLQLDFWKGFIGNIRSVVAEGTNNTLLTDNYIRLNTEIKTHTNINKIIDVEIAQISGRPWAIPVKDK